MAGVRDIIGKIRQVHAQTIINQCGKFQGFIDKLKDAAVRVATSNPKLALNHLLEANDALLATDYLNELSITLSKDPFAATVTVVTDTGADTGADKPNEAPVEVPVEVPPPAEQLPPVPGENENRAPAGEVQNG